MKDNAIWGYLHDGSLDRIDGTLPGGIKVYISIPYLRNAFQPAGEGFVLTLTNCTKFTLESDSGVVIHDIGQIAVDSPELLSIESEEPLLVYTTLGTLAIDYQAITIALDTGQPLTTRMLDQASEQYWQAWEEKHRGSV